MPQFTRFHVEKNLVLKYICGEKMTNMRSDGRYFIMFVWSLSFLVASPLLAYRKTNVFKVRISGNHQERNKGKNREYKTTRTLVFSVAETNTHTKRRHCRNRNTEQAIAKEYCG